MNNCGPNDEAFSFHGLGCNVVFVDGHVSFLRDDLDPIIMRRLCTPREGIPVNQINAGLPASILRDAEY